MQNTGNSFAAVREGKSNIFRIICGKGKYKESINKTVRESVSNTDLMKINKIYNDGEHELFDNAYIARYKSTSGNEAILFVENQIRNNYIDIDLLDIFHKSISATFDNLCLNLEIEETQKEILYTLGEVAEARSEETGFHVKRVSKYCELLGELYGLS
jgi:response regulator RpfG family c-di-GMP phosphodiesterase